MARNLDTVRIEECGEPMVELRSACPLLVIDCGHPYARAGVAARLNVAAEALRRERPELRLRVGEAFRPIDRQRVTFRRVYLLVRLARPFWTRARVRQFTGVYVADPDAQAPPPHATGGAVDVGLVDAAGRKIDMGPFRLAAAPLDAPGLTAVQRANRASLARAMQCAGFSNYAEEWWHWSYGDSGWAMRTGAPAAMYGLATL